MSELLANHQPPADETDTDKSDNRSYQAPIDKSEDGKTDHTILQVAMFALAAQDAVRNFRQEAGTTVLPPREIKSFLSIALICTTRRRILATASTSHGLEKGGLIPL